MHANLELSGEDMHISKSMEHMLTHGEGILEAKKKAKRKILPKKILRTSFLGGSKSRCMCRI